MPLPLLADPPPSVVDAWRGALVIMPPSPSPCRYLDATRWQVMQENGLDFLDRFGAEAVRLGWTASQLFGVHPQHGTLRGDYCGALMLTGNKARGVEPTHVWFERTAAFRNTPGKPEGVPIWTFAAAKKGK